MFQPLAATVTAMAASGFFVAVALLPCGCTDTPAPASVTTTANRNVTNVDLVPVETRRTTSTTRPSDWFEDVTDRTGVHFTHRNGREAGRFFMIESFGGGVAAVDYDRDGDCDLFVSAGGDISRTEPVKICGLPAALFRNLGDFQFGDVSWSSGITDPPDYSQGCAVTDFDADGFPDLFLCCYGRSRLYHNRGDGTFQEVGVAAHLTHAGWATTACFADLDQDGLSDLVVGRYTDWTPEKDVPCITNQVRDLCPPTSYRGTSCLAFRNAGDGTFEDWSERFGMRDGVRALGVVAADLNVDGQVDVYVASDVTANQLYLGGSQLPLTECATTAGVAVNEWGQPEASMGVDIGDYNGDGLPDIWITNFEREDNALYRNLSGGAFLYSTVSTGLAGVSRMRVGFGTSMTDFDGDGWPDLFVLNGNPIYTAAETPFKQQSQLFRNVEGRFEEVSNHGGTFFHESYSGRGNAAVDLDDDGALDLVVVPLNDPVRILRNQQQPTNYIRIQLAPRKGEPDATGARVICEFNGRQVTQFATRGTGFFSQPDPRMIFPAAEHSKSVDVTVSWPGRSREVFHCPVRTTQILVEGRGEPVHD